PGAGGGARRLRARAHRSLQGAALDRFRRRAAAAIERKDLQAAAARSLLGRSRLAAGLNGARAVTLAPPTGTPPRPWVGGVLIRTGALAHLALGRDEPVGAVWLLTAAVCVYAIAYRFYSAFLAARVTVLDAERITPAVRIDDGHDFVPTNRWV